MDKFELNQLSLLGDLIAELQLCFIDDDAYSRTPSAREWRTASRIAHRLKLLICELRGYATACRQYEIVSIRERLHVASGNKGGDAEPNEPNNQKENPDVGTSGENVRSVEFTEKEIQQMPKQFKTKYRINKKIVSCRYHHCGGNSYTYELRYRAEGYNISASGKTIERAKARFLKKLNDAQSDEGEFTVPKTFSAFAMYYFENFRQRKVTPKTYRCDLQRLKLHILPYFKETALTCIRPLQCQRLIEHFESIGQTKTAQELYGLLSVIFKAAIAHRLIDFNPLSLVLNVKHESEHGEALSKAEEETLLAALEGTPYQSAFALALFTGLRPNEYKTAKIEGAFVVAVNSKRKTKTVEYKRIPICKRLAAYLNVQPVSFPCYRYMREKVKEILPNHKLYDLRTTFYSRCDELGVAPPARDEFVGHSNGALTNAYRDLSDEYLLKEGKKLDLW